MTAGEGVSDGVRRPKATARAVPRPFELHWGNGQIVEEATGQPDTTSRRSSSWSSPMDRNRSASAITTSGGGSSGVH